jgi:hypothetical protein
MDNTSKDKVKTCFYIRVHLASNIIKIVHESDNKSMKILVYNPANFIMACGYVRKLINHHEITYSIQRRLNKLGYKEKADSLNYRFQQTEPFVEFI